VSHGADAVFAQPGFPNRHAAQGLTLESFDRSMALQAWNLFESISADEKWKWSNVMFELHQLSVLEDPSKVADNVWRHRFKHAYLVVDMV
jgi:hypothetical protein